MKKELFSGTFFLVISILTTAAAAAGVMSGTPEVFSILFAISAWLIYASAKDDGKVGGIALGNGTIKAMFIVGWVVTGILAVTGLVVMFIPASLLSGPLFRIGGTTVYGLFGDDMGDISKFFSFAGSAAFVWLGLSLLVSAAVTAVVNIFYVRGLLTFIRSLRRSAENDMWDVEKVEMLSKWMFVLGIITATGIMGFSDDGLRAFAAGCAGAAMIVTSRWLKLKVLPTCVESIPQPQSEWYSSEQ